MSCQHRERHYITMVLFAVVVLLVSKCRHHDIIHADYATSQHPSTIHMDAALYSTVRCNRIKPLVIPHHPPTIILLCLALSGDIELNPGPRPIKHECGICQKTVRSNDPAVCCDQCNFWIHNKCSGLSDTMYDVFKWSDGV